MYSPGKSKLDKEWDTTLCVYYITIQVFFLGEHTNYKIVNILIYLHTNPCK